MSKLARVRLGELIALAGAAAVIVSLTLAWYGGASGGGGAAPGGDLGAWSTFGAAIVFLLLACVSSIALVLATLFERSPALPLSLAVWSTVLGSAAVIAAIVRIAERPAGSSSLLAGPWLALAGAVAVTIGSLCSLRDERQGLYQPASPQRRHL